MIINLPILKKCEDTFLCVLLHSLCHFLPEKIVLCILLETVVLKVKNILLYIYIILY